MTSRPGLQRAHSLCCSCSVPLGNSALVQSSVDSSGMPVGGGMILDCGGVTMRKKGNRAAPKEAPFKCFWRSDFQHEPALMPGQQSRAFISSLRPLGTWRLGPWGMPDTVMVAWDEGKGSKSLPERGLIVTREAGPLHLVARWHRLTPSAFCMGRGRWWETWRGTLASLASQGLLMS